MEGAGFSVLVGIITGEILSGSESRPVTCCSDGGRAPAPSSALRGPEFRLLSECNEAFQLARGPGLCFPQPWRAQVTWPHVAHLLLRDRLQSSPEASSRGSPSEIRRETLTAALLPGRQPSELQIVALMPGRAGGSLGREAQP